MRLIRQSKRKEEIHFQNKLPTMISKMIISPEEMENAEMLMESLIQLTLISQLVQMTEDQRTFRRELETSKLVNKFV